MRALHFYPMAVYPRFIAHGMRVFVCPIVFFLFSEFVNALLMWQFVKLVPVNPGVSLEKTLEERERERDGER